MLSLVLAAFAAAFYGVHARSRLARLDEELARLGELTSRNVAADLAEGLELAVAAHDALEDVAMAGRQLGVFDAAGELVAGRWELPAPAPGGARSQDTFEVRAGAFRAHGRNDREGATVYRIGVAESLAPMRRELLELRNALAGSLLASLLLAAAGGWWIARAALKPVELLAAQARRISERTPGDRLAAPGAGDELGSLAGAFNELLGRLEAAIAQQRQFMADASHELRTPVSVARTAVEVALGRSGRPEREYREALAVVGEQARRLSRIVDDLFLLARADASGLRLERRPVYLDELVGESVAEARLLAEPRGVSLGWQGPESLELAADEGLLRRLLGNLLHNAVRHTPSGGAVRVEISLDDGAVEVAVVDGGDGVPEAERERIFDRFVRLDGARAAGEGAGLGLPIARAIAEAHGGRLELAESGASGSRFLVRLPRA